MTTCEIAIQTEGKQKKYYYYPDAVKNYRDKLKQMNNGKVYTPKNAQYMRTYREKLKKQKQEQEQKDLEIKLKV